MGAGFSLRSIPTLVHSVESTSPRVPPRYSSGVFLGQGKLECAARFDRSIESPHIHAKKKKKEKKLAKASERASKREREREKERERVRAFRTLVNFKG